MNRFVRFGGAALGMVLLAGLALYQGNNELAPDEQDMMSGTALAEATETTDIDCDPGLELDNPTTPPCDQLEQLSDND